MFSGGIEREKWHNIGKIMVLLRLSNKGGWPASLNFTLNNLLPLNKSLERMNFQLEKKV